MVAGQKSRRYTAATLILGVVLLSGGCQREQGPPVGQRQRAPTRDRVATVKRYTVEQIGGRLGGYLPPLDEGRLRVAPPEDWHVEPRRKEYVVRFVLADKLPLPRITITAQDADFQQPRILDEASLPQFLEQIEQSLSDKRRNAMVEPYKPMILGAVPCIRGVIGKRFKHGTEILSGESQVIKTLHAGRIYTIALDVLKGTLIENKNRAYVVVAGMEFLATAPSGSERDADKPPAEPGKDADRGKRDTGAVKPQSDDGA